MLGSGGRARAEETPAVLAAAAAAAGCEVTADEVPGVSLAPWPGAPGVLAVAALTGGPGDDDLGLLCAGAVRRAGAGFAPVARLAPDAPDIAPPSGMTPVSRSDVAVDGAVYAFAPGEMLLGVRVYGETNTTSINVSVERLYLFRRTGARLTPVFDAQTASGLIDKTGGGDDREVSRIVRFDRRLRTGAYGLVLARKGAREGRRYVWSGSRYVKAR